MNSQNLSKKSRKELNGSLMKLYRQLTYKSDSEPGKVDQNSSSVVNDEQEPEERQDFESDVTPAIGIGI